MVYKEEKVFSLRISRTGSDYPTAAGYLEQSVFYPEIRFTDLPGALFVCSLSHLISLSALSPMLASLYRIWHAQFKFQTPFPINDTQFVVYNNERSSSQKILCETIKLP